MFDSRVVTSMILVTTLPANYGGIGVSYMAYISQCQNRHTHHRTLHSIAW